jgi:hypothetical protein
VLQAVMARTSSQRGAFLRIIISLSLISLIKTHLG